MGIIVSDNGCSIKIEGGGVVTYVQKTKVEVSNSGTTVRIQWDSINFIAYDASQYSSPSGSAQSISDSIALMLNVNCAGGGGGGFQGIINQTPPVGSYVLLVGLLDGVNKVFTTSAAYTTGKLSVYMNGQLVAQGVAPNAWSETSPAAGTFTFVTAPFADPGDGSVTVITAIF